MAEYLAFHYLDPADLLPKGVPTPRQVSNFPATCARLLLVQAKARKVRPCRALDLGCAVGRSSFELARRVPEVLGIDISRSFIRTARKLQNRGKLGFKLLEEGCLTRNAVARVPAGIDKARVRFTTGDALRLPKGLGSFDLVLAANLIDRVPDPKRLLSKILPSLVRCGGLLLLTSPYTWSADFTPPANWLASHSTDSFSALRSHLRSSFRLIHRQNLPFLLREHRRKFQFTFADATFWKRL